MTSFSDPRFSGIVFDSTRDGIVITDAENRILAANPAFTRITGYSQAEVVGKTPAILKSGRHDAAFYAAMWAALNETGHWQGEIWDRRKNGEVYLEVLTINAVKDPDGRLSHYVAVFTDIHRLYESESQLEQLTYFDHLTELPNRTLLNDRLEQAIALAKRTDHQMAVIYLDLDHFKTVNDRYGQTVGNALLVELACRLRQAMRSTDTLARLAMPVPGARPGDTVARVGGDEFVLLASGLTGLDALEVVVNRVQRLVAEPCEIKGREIRVTASMGVTIFPLDAADAGTLLRHADQAMYQAKEAGRNRYHLFDAERDQQAHTRRQLLERLKEALARHEFTLHYQPKVNLRSGAIIGLEALLRWQHPQDGLILPGEFLPHVEHDDLIIEIGNWVLCSVLDQLTAWREAGLDLKVSVNVAARQLLRADFIAGVRTCLASYPAAPADRLELEILESSAIANTAHVRTVMQACQALGIGFALDDFGTGYASLTYLKEIPAEVLKIDQSFIRNVLDESDDLALVEGIIGLAAAFRRIAVAEGVETAEQGVLLMRLGCDLAQGFGIARPMPAEQVGAWLDDYRPNPQWALWADTRWEMEDFPLLVAQYDHIKWVKRVALYLDGGGLQLSEAELTDHHQCRFGHWYYGHGQVRYGHLTEFRELEPVHVAVHQIGPEIVRLRREGDLEAARNQLRELLHLKDQILERLSRLQTAVARQARSA